MMTLFAVAAVGAAGVLLLACVMRRLRYRAQFLVLCSLGLSVGFLFLALVELPTFSLPLGVLLMTVVFVASFVAVPIFLRSLDQEEKDESFSETSIRNSTQEIRARD
ncbi:MAG: hypothetical protein ACRD59_07845 [Candidatus Acidiferrales bacterium]